MPLLSCFNITGPSCNGVCNSVDYMCVWTTHVYQAVVPKGSGYMWRHWFTKLTWQWRMMVHMSPRMMDGRPSVISEMFMFTSLILSNARDRNETSCRFHVSVYYNFHVFCANVQTFSWGSSALSQCWPSAERCRGPFAFSVETSHDNSAVMRKLQRETLHKIFGLNSP